MIAVDAGILNWFYALMRSVLRVFKRKPGAFRFNKRTITIAIPMVWLLVFFMIPFFIVLKISFSEAVYAQPPFMPLLQWEEGGRFPQILLNLENYLFLLSDKLYAVAYLNSVKIAFISTLLCLAFAWPTAWMVARAPDYLRHILLIMVIVPFWTSFLLRIYALLGIFSTKGVINDVLKWFGREQPLVILHTDLAVYIGIAYSYLPLMLLPLYVTFVKLDESLLEASRDLGANAVQTFFRVIVPVSLPGIVAGSLLVFIPAVGEYVIPALLGGPENLMIGKILWVEFSQNRDWPVASAVSIVLLLILVVPLMWFRSQPMAERKV